MPRRSLAIALGLVLLGPGRARAAGLEVSPVQVELTQQEPNALVSLHNGGETAVRFQVTVQGWTQGLRGELELSPTHDVAFFPALLTLAPGERRNLRIGAQAPFGEVEKTYRLFVEELPPPPGAAQTGVRVLTRVGIPVYLEPRQGGLPRPAVTDLERDGRNVRFRLRNAGTVRVKPVLVRLVGRGEHGELVFEQAVGCWYVLAGGERLLEGEVPADRCGLVRRLAVEANLERGGTVEGALDTPGGACGP